MTMITLEEAQARLAELIETKTPGQELWILKDDQIVAKLIVQPKPSIERREPGFMKGSVLYMSPDFDAPMELANSPK